MLRTLYILTWTKRHCCPELRCEIKGQGFDHTFNCQLFLLNSAKTLTK